MDNMSEISEKQRENSEPGGKLNGCHGNLKPFQKGISGNPGGRPKGVKSLKALIEKFGKREAPEELLTKIRMLFPAIRKISLKEAVILRTLVEAVSGESWAVQFIADRTEGKAVDQTTLEMESRMAAIEERLSSLGQDRSGRNAKVA
jgi:hypothetical protein